MTARGRGPTWNDIEHLASGSLYERESALRRARTRLEEFLRNEGFAPVKGGVVEQVVRYADKKGMDSREIRAVVGALRYRNETEHEDKEAGRLGTRTAVAVMRIFCAPDHDRRVLLAPTSFLSMFATIEDVAPSLRAQFLEFFERDLGHFEKKRIDDACRQGQLSREELRVIVCQPADLWRDALLGAVERHTGKPPIAELWQSVLVGLASPSDTSLDAKRAERVLDTVTDLANDISVWAQGASAASRARHAARKAEWAERDRMRAMRARRVKLALLAVFLIGGIAIVAYRLTH